MAALCWRKREERPHVQGKRNTSKTVGVARGHERAVTLKPQSQKTSQSDHTDWFQIGKGVRQGCIWSPCLFNLYAEYIMRNAGQEEGQAGIKIAGRNINNLRYADDTAFMAENEEELKSLLIKVK